MQHRDEQAALLEWRDGNTPVSVRFSDPYYSVHDGLAESEHVFLAGNNLPERFRPGFHVAELGFGTGLNLLSLWRAWLSDGQTGKLCFTSFEAFPMTADDMKMALSRWPELWPLADIFLAQYAAGKTIIETDQLRAEIIIGDARKTLPHWQGHADAWFLDGFNPATNPELWNADILAQIARHTASGGSFATYTAAGHIRRGLQNAGFEVSKVTGFAHKRHMTIGRLSE